jgi:hypothetical protein
MVPRYSGTGRQQRSSQKPRAFTLTPCAWWSLSLVFLEIQD